MSAYHPDARTAMPAVNNQHRPKSDHRTDADIERHYLIEKELATRLRNAERADRLHLYTELYDEIYEQVPNIPGWNDPLPAAALARNVANKVSFLSKFAGKDSIFLELGPGDCAVSLAMTQHVAQVYAVDVSTGITSQVDPPENFKLLISDGVSVDVPENSIDVAYSSNLMEHLHPDDAIEQLGNIMRALKPGGVYICITPSRLSGPHDVSKYFDETPTGFHLREYSTTEMAKIFREAGFSKVKPYLWIKQKLVVFPLFSVIVAERLLQWLPRNWCRYVCNRFPANHFVSRVIAYVPEKKRTS